MVPKILAYYLPAFHEIPENNMWYGEGFTEWDNNKKGEKLYKKHNQPRVPLNNNYYDLSNVETMRWQCDLAKKYGVYGFCFYHYWFSGRKILEKPAEMLLKNKDINIHFCFAWANEPWKDTWTENLGEPKMLIDQSYDKENDWEDHFSYLLPFFQDERYIKIDEMPVFLIYRLESINDFKSKFEIWNNLAIKNGFKGIYLIKMNAKDVTCKIKDGFNAQVDFEPNFTMGSRRRYCYSIWRFRRTFYSRVIKKTPLYKHIFDRIPYKKFCKSLLKKKHIVGDYFYSFFTDWDNSPRKGRRGSIMDNASISVFEQTLSTIIKDSLKNKKEYIFLFAWNEWGEGAYLEPDEAKKYGFLEAIERCVSLYNEDK